MCLSLEQIKLVETDVKNENINFSHLADDLIDHICSDIESQIEQGKNFEEAYKLVKEKIGMQGLRNIQCSTLMLMDKNYRIMKKSMRRTGIISMAIMPLAVIFKMQHWPGAGIMLTLSYFLLVFVFFPSLLYVLYKELNKKKQAYLFILTFFFGLLFMTSFLFKIQHWPGANIMMLLGGTGISLVSIPLLIISKTRKDKKTRNLSWLGFLAIITFLGGFLAKYLQWPGGSVGIITGGTLLVSIYMPLLYLKKFRKDQSLRLDFIFGMIVSIYIVIFSTLLNLNISSNTLNDFVIQQHNYQEIGKAWKRKSNTFTIESNNKIIRQGYQLIEDIDELKADLICTTNHIDKSTAQEYVTKPWLIGRKEQNSTLTKFLLKQTNGKTPLSELTEGIQLYKKSIKTFYIKEKLSSKSIGQILESLTTEGENLHYMPLVAVLDNLTILQYKIRLINTSLKNNLLEK